MTRRRRDRSRAGRGRTAHGSSRTVQRAVRSAGQSGRGLRNRRGVPKTLVLALGALIGVALGLVLPSRIVPGGATPLNVQRVSVAGASRVAPSALARRAEVAPGTPFREVDEAAVAARVARDPWVATARATTLAPDQLLLAVVEREPALVAWLGEPAQAWHVDADGVPFAPVEYGAEEGPSVHGLVEFEPGVASRDLLRVLRVLEAMKERDLPPPRRIELAGDDARALPVLVLDALGGERRVLLGAGEIEPKLDRLARLVAARPAAAGSARTWDVRFDGQIVLPPDPEAVAGESEAGARDARAG